MDLAYYKKMEPFWGAWYIEEEIGKGSFGHVFKIKREDFGETYYSALKIISIPNEAGEVSSLRAEGMDAASISAYYDSFAAELVKEFSIMAKTKGHSNIVSYEDHMAVKHADGIGYDILIRMELLTPLNNYLIANGMNEDTVLKLGINMCNALEVCAQNNIIHRDIKPENVFVSRYNLFKLGDFGVSRVASQATQGMSIKGTIAYMAPEVYKGHWYNLTVDIYSLGIMLYRLCNNNRGPFLLPPPHTITYSEREVAEGRRMRGEELPDAAKASPELMRIIRKATAYNYQERYRNAVEMRDDLEMLALRGKQSQRPFADSQAVRVSATPVNAPVQPIAKPSVNESVVRDHNETVSLEDYEKEKAASKAPVNRSLEETVSIHDEKPAGVPGAKAFRGDEETVSMLDSKAAGAVAVNVVKPDDDSTVSMATAGSRAAQQRLTKEEALSEYKQGDSYYFGRGVRKDIRIAVSHYKKAAALGNADAAFRLGECYYFGRGVEKNPETAVMWYRKAAGQGQVSAQINLAVCCSLGEGTAENFKEAADWYRKAAEKGRPVAQYWLGYCYSLGKGVEKDYKSAAIWLRKAATQGYAPAQLLLGKCYYDGMGVERDIDEAERWYRKAAERGDAQAAELLKKNYR